MEREDSEENYASDEAYGQKSTYKNGTTREHRKATGQGQSKPPETTRRGYVTFRVDPASDTHP